jgi:carboxymethylenebutenolidase
VKTEQVSIRTKDGDCRAWLFIPEGVGPWPAAIFYMDGLAIRPPLLDMAARLAAGGYVVLLPDLFYRAGPYAPLDPAVVFAGGDVRKALAHLFTSTDNKRAAEDSGAFIAYLDTRSEVAGPKIGTTGYCMGGGISLTVAGTYPDRIAAAASFHGGNLATDDPLSPHLLAPAMKARVLVAGAKWPSGLTRR